MNTVFCMTFTQVILHDRLYITRHKHVFSIFQPSDRDSGVYKANIKTPQGELMAEAKINIKGMLIILLAGFHSTQQLRSYGDVTSVYSLI